MYNLIDFFIRFTSCMASLSKSQVLCFFIEWRISLPEVNWHLQNLLNVVCFCCKYNISIIIILKLVSYHSVQFWNSGFLTLQVYIKESDNLVLLHDQIRDCDNILSQMETLLGGFQVYKCLQLLFHLCYDWNLNY